MTPPPAAPGPDHTSPAVPPPRPAAFSSLRRRFAPDAVTAPDDTAPGDLRWGRYWIIAAVVAAVVLGFTLSGPVVVLAFPLAVLAGTMALVVGVGGVPGTVWALPLVPLALLLVSSRTFDGDWGQPSGIVAVVVLALVETYAVLVSRRGRRDLAERAARGEAVTGRLAARSSRRALDVRLVGYTCLLLGGDPDLIVLALTASVFALLRRRRWTSAVAIAACGVSVFVGVRDVSLMGVTLADTARPFVLAALTVHWTHALFHPAWRYGKLAAAVDAVRAVDALRQRAASSTAAWPSGDSGTGWHTTTPLHPVPPPAGPPVPSAWPRAEGPPVAFDPPVPPAGPGPFPPPQGPSAPWGPAAGT
ncbi:hypothetical protein ACSNN9_15085 [Micromonospora sp. URMC 107]|uniref:hypothetical protein n=1 Tax=Micromonospora sp. URMC 107 TaxID=3423418 RepID=UPI003F1D925C